MKRIDINSVSDMKLSSVVDAACIPAAGPVSSNPQPFDIDLVAVNNYYPFGMLQPGQIFSSESYRFGFNGKENDNEVKGTGNSIDFGDRSYDSRTTRWLSKDLKKDKYPAWSPYHFGYNSPIATIDPDGCEDIIIVGAQYQKEGNKMTFAAQAIRSARLSYNSIEDKREETMTILVFRKGYTDKQIKAIEQAAAKYKATVIPINSSNDLVNYINSKNVGDNKVSAQRESDKVTDVDIFAHGKPFIIEFGYEIDKETRNMYLFGKNVADKISSEAFGENAVITSFACRTGIGTESEKNGDIALKNSLAQHLANVTGTTVKAYATRTEYDLTWGPRGNLNMLIANLFKSAWLQQTTGETKVDGALWNPTGAYFPVIQSNTPSFAPTGIQTYKPEKNNDEKKDNTQESQKGG